MPNHVFHYITPSTDLTAQQIDKLQEIEKVGLCQYYLPMPEEIRNTQSPTLIVSDTEYKRIMEENKKIDRTQPYYHESKPITKKMQNALIKKYDVDNWYDWANNNWGTKWGCYDNEIDGGTLRFCTAWAPMADEIIEAFSKDFPSFIWHWEEEQGYGATIVYENGVITEGDGYEPINYSTIGWFKDKNGFTWDVHHTNGRPQSLSTEEVPAGYYLDYGFNESDYLGTELPSNIKEKLVS
jgi:hypothetical protein